MADNKKDKEIINAIRTGNNSFVLNHLYKVALPKIIRLVIQNNGDEEEAKDVFQDAVVALFNTVKLNKYDENREIDGFLYFVARNLWINRIKKRNRQQDIMDTKLDEYTDSPLVSMISEEKQTAINELMEQIGTQCKELLKYAMYDGLSMKEIAQKMGLSGETVAKTTHYRCKQKLAKLIYGNKTLISLFKE
ncbi:MAG TPA: sigma-70 family RNA polymerase sigma factor [Cytophagales bacterium]|nr:sigma-70 family RNA polymerase sigma factor [Cytophagales bacterium]